MGREPIGKNYCLKLQRVVFVSLHSAFCYFMVSHPTQGNIIRLAGSSASKHPVPGALCPVFWGVLCGL